MSTHRSDFPDAQPPQGRWLLDARLQLLDRQLLDADGEPVGILDDLVVDRIDTGHDVGQGSAPPKITAILTGQVLATRIFGGRPPRSRLQPLPWRLVAKVGIVVTLRPIEGAIDGLWVEHWLRDHLIGRIPGGRHAAQ
jgi:hypothetical protein